MSAILVCRYGVSELAERDKLGAGRLVDGDPVGLGDVLVGVG